MTDQNVVGIPLNKRGTERLQIAERESAGKGVFVDVRKFYLVVEDGTKDKAEGELSYLPTKKGISLSHHVWAMVIDELLKNPEIKGLVRA